METQRRELFDSLAHFVAPDSVVYDDVRLALGNDVVRAQYTRPETTFDADSVYKRIVVFVLTERRLILFYSDTNYEMDPRGEFVTTVQSVRLADIKEHQLIRRRELEGENAGRLNSAILRLRWGLNWQQDLVPGQCDDPGCTNDHGFVGMVTNEDFQMYLDRTNDSEYFEQGVGFMQTVAADLGAESWRDRD